LSGDAPAGGRAWILFILHIKRITITNNASVGVQFQTRGVGCRRFRISATIEALPCIKFKMFFRFCP
jgi:hypothetical protein